MLRILVNFLLGGFWVAVFDWLGWFHLRSEHLLQDPFMGKLVDCSIIAVVIGIVGHPVSR